MLNIGCNFSSFMGAYLQVIYVLLFINNVTYMDGSVRSFIVVASVIIQQSVVLIQRFTQWIFIKRQCSFYLTRYSGR